MRYDSVYGRYDRFVEAGTGRLTIDNRTIPVYSEKSPENLPWKDLGVDVVFECTGVFRKEEERRKHLDAGVKHVVLSAPAKSDSVTTVVYGASDMDGFPETD